MTNISLNPTEALHVLMVLHKDAGLDSPTKTLLIDKLKSGLLTVLEAEEERKKDEDFLAWQEQENKKINNLNKQNSTLDKTFLESRRK